MTPVHQFEPIFAAEDLPYNRRGELSPGQKARLAADSRGCLARLLIFNGIAVALIVITSLISAQAFNQIGVFGIMMLFPGLPWLIISLLPTPKSVYDIKRAKGTPKISMGYTSGQSKYYMLVVDGVDFRISMGLYNALEKRPDADVAAYYTSSGARNSLVSWEFV